MKRFIIFLILAAAIIMACLVGCENPNVPKTDKVGSYAKTSSTYSAPIYVQTL